MATVTYDDLKRKGHILQAEDSLTLHGIQYGVVKPAFLSHYWLTTIEKSASMSNDAVFDSLNLDISEFLSKLFGSSFYTGVFPEMDSAEKLTKLVIALYEQPMFHPGDEVKIAEYEKGIEYPFGFTDYMRKLSGNQYTIKEIDTSFARANHSYILEDAGFYWSENQLILVNRASEAAKDTVKEQDVQNADIQNADTTSINYVTLDMLKAGYVFKETDHIRIGSLDCVINSRFDSCDGTSNKLRYWISLERRLENNIYDELEISKEEKDKMAEKCGAASTYYASPEFKSLEDLSKFVIMLLEYNKTPKDNPMREVTYTDLKEGKVLSTGNMLSIYGLEYSVKLSSISNKYYLSNSQSCDNSAIFNKLGRADDRYNWARKFEASVNNEGMFPEFKSLENLTKFVIDIFREVGYKEASSTAATDFSSKIAAISKEAPVFEESKESISILPKKIKTNIIL